MTRIDEIDAILPQTQCGECGYPGCRPYAIALAEGSAAIDKCPPGGVTTLRALGRYLQVDTTPFEAAVTAQTRAPSIAAIREAECIGCTKCIQACPVDAIIGTAKQMHSIITHECTGCGLCVAPCPVDCIELHPQDTASFDKPLARKRYQMRQIRLLQEAQEKEAVYREKRRIAAQSPDRQKEQAAKKSYILDALARVKARRGHE